MEGLIVVRSRVYCIWCKRLIGRNDVRVVSVGKWVRQVHTSCYDALARRLGNEDLAGARLEREAEWCEGPARCAVCGGEGEHDWEVHTAEARASRGEEW